MATRNNPIAKSMLLALILLIAGLAFAQGFANATEATAGTTEGTTIGGPMAGWFKDWRVLAILAVAISLTLVSIAYVVATGLNLREVRAWAQVELVQVFGSALLIMALIGFISFMDSVSQELSTNAAYGIACTNTEPCSFTIAKAYIDQLSGVAKDKGKNILLKSVDAAAKAMNRGGGQVNSQYVLWAGANWGPSLTNTGLLLKLDRYSLLFNHIANILAALSAQRQFLEVIAFALGPALLLFGIIFRTFFFTRKLGGLLLAAAISMMFVYPLLYVFSWFTLAVSVHSDNAFSSESPDCPAECRLTPPETEECSTDEWCGQCPLICREVPFPRDLPACVAAEEACFKCPEKCKVARERTDCVMADVCGEGNCPQGCWSTLPHEDATCVACLDLTYRADNKNSSDKDCPFFCRANINNAFLYSAQPECNPTQSPKCTGDCSKPECITTVPDTSLSCDQTCAGCPEYCRVNLPLRCSLEQSIACTVDSECSGHGTCEVLDNSGWFASLCVGEETPYGTACGKCPVTCKATPGSVTGGCAPPVNTDETKCKACPEQCRWDQSALNTRATVAGVPDLTTACEETDPPDPFLPDISFERICSNTSIYPDACNTTNCPTACRVGWSKVCREYDAAGPSDNCGHCPEFCRATLTIDGTTATTRPAGCDAFESQCSLDNCPTACQQPLTEAIATTMIIPYKTGCEAYDADSYSSQSGTMLDGAAPNCRACPEECRLRSGLAPSDPACKSALATNIKPSATMLSVPYSTCASAKPECNDISCCVNFTIATCDKALVYSSGIVSICSAPDYAASILLATTGSPVSVSASPPRAVSAPLVNGYYYRQNRTETTATGTTYFCERMVYKATRYVCNRGTVCDAVGCASTCKISYEAPRACAAYEGEYALSNLEKTYQQNTFDMVCTVPLPSEYSVNYFPAADKAACKQCPLSCRAYDEGANCNLPTYDVLCEAPFCYDFCKVSTPPITANCLEYNPPYCAGCPLACRVTLSNPEDQHPACAADERCDPSLCPTGICRPALPGDNCENCSACPQDCSTATSYQGALIHIRTDCAEVCGTGSGVTTFGVSEFTGSGAATSDEDMQAVGVLMVPAFILPLFNMVVTLSFIRVLSPMLGGDYDIPGISKLI